MKSGPARTQRSWPIERDDETAEAPSRPDRHRPPAQRTVVDTARAVEQLAGMATNLPGSLLALSSELRARQAAGEIRLRPDQAQSQPNVEAVIGAARYALAEATTAAHVLTQRLDDAVRLLTDVVDS